MLNSGKRLLTEIDCESNVYSCRLFSQVTERWLHTAAVVAVLPYRPVFDAPKNIYWCPCISSELRSS